MKSLNDDFTRIPRKEIRSNLHTERKKKWDELKGNPKAGAVQKKEIKKVNSKCERSTDVGTTRWN